MGNDLDTTSQSKKKGLKLVKVLLLLLFTVAALIFAAMSPVFNIHEVSVQGIHYNSYERIIDTANIKTGENGFINIGYSFENFILMRYGKVEDKLKEAFPYIKEAVVKFILPDRVYISILEKTPKLTIIYDDKYVSADEEGYVLEVSDSILYNLPIVSGMIVEDVQEGKLLKTDENIYNKLIELISHIKEVDSKSDFQIKEDINYFDVSVKEQLSIHYDARIEVIMSYNSDFEYTIKLMKHILKENLGKSEKGILDMRYGKSSVFTSQKDGG